MAQQKEKYPIQSMLTPFQVVQLTSASYLPLLFWVFPRFAVEKGSYDAQWSIVLLVLVGAVVGWVQGRLNHRFPEDTGIDYLARVYGKWIGKGLGFLYVVTYIFFVGVGMRMFVFLVGALYMPNTPPVVLIVLFLGVSVYGARLGLETLAKISSVFNPPVTFGLMATFLTALLEYPPFGLPMAMDKLMNLLNGTYYLMPMLFGFNLFQMLAPFYKKTKRSYMYPIVSMGLNGALMVFALFVTVAMLGWEFVRRVQWSLPFLFREIYLGGFVIERVGVSMIIISLIFNVLFTANHLWGLSLCWTRLLNRKGDSYRMFIFPTAFLVGLVAWFFQSERTMEGVVMMYLTPISWVMLFVIPAVTLMLAAIRKLGEPGPPKEAKKQESKKKSTKSQKKTVNV